MKTHVAARGAMAAIAVASCSHGVPIGHLLVANGEPAAAVPVELTLERALPIDIVDDFQPSGLTLYDGHLLTVSDKHDAAIYELVLGPDSASLRPFVSFEAPADAPSPIDIEGIAADGDGALLLASETHYRALRVDRTGRAAWLTPSLEEVGHGAGLFQKHNANLEGLTRLADGRLLFAAEREPRGLIELPADRDVSRALAWAMPVSTYPVPIGRNVDFSDLTTVDGAVYALERASALVVRMERGEGGWHEREAWSFRRTEDDPRYAYSDSRYGTCEGLAIDAARVYVVTDNNRLARAADPTDRRPQLFVFMRPAPPSPMGR